MKSETRRPMSAALKTVELPPEALSLIREGTPQSRVETPRVEKPVFAQPRVKVDEEDEPPRRPVRRNEPEPAAVGLAFLSFRLPQPVAEALLRASLERKLQRMRPWTQQEITAEALTGWLRKQGFLD
jgi:hypothetical protein